MSSIIDPNTLKTDAEWLSFLVPILPKLTSILAFHPHFSHITVGNTGVNCPTQKAFKAYKKKFLQKTTELYTSIESYPDKDEIVSFLCNRFVTSIFPEFIRLQIFPIRISLLHQGF